MASTLLDRPAPTAAEGWLTASLRPAGAMTPEAADRFSAALAALAGCSAVVLVDLSASGPLPRRARRALAAADTRLAAAGGALVLLDRGGPLSTARSGSADHDRPAQARQVSGTPPL